MAQGLPRRKTTANELRRRFNQRGLWSDVQAGKLMQHVVKDRHPSPPVAKEPICTRSQLVRYADQRGKTVALVHQYLRQDGTLGASGRPDPKMLLDGGELLHL
jgi:hypothetical protein